MVVMYICLINSNLYFLIYLSFFLDSYKDVLQNVADNSNIYCIYFHE